MSNAVVTMVRKVSLDIPPDGVYQGRWGGYQVSFDAGGSQWIGTASIGIRTPNAPATVTVRDGVITVEVAR